MTEAVTDVGRAALEQFEQMVQSHDLTYSYSDDGDWWRRGQASFDKIVDAARDLPVEDVTRIWNAMCDSRVIKDVAPEFYWKDSWLTAKGDGR